MAKQSGAQSAQDNLPKGGPRNTSRPRAVGVPPPLPARARPTGAAHNASRTPPPLPARRTAKRKGKVTWGKRFHRAFHKFLQVVLVYLVASNLWVISYRVINPPLTPLYVKRWFEQAFGPDDVRYRRTWVDIEEMGRTLPRSVLAAEDQRHYVHNGFELGAMRLALKNNMSGKSLRGGSTISQQTAKNVFLWPHRNMLRKLFEAYYTCLIELWWGKKRILEVYLNSVEFGDGIYGAQEGAKLYYTKSVSQLSREQCFELACLLPAPRTWHPSRPTPNYKGHLRAVRRNFRYTSKLPIF